MSEPGPAVITQIAVSNAGPDVLYALASDGTVWRLVVTLGTLEAGWFQLPGLPAEGAPPGGRSGPV